MASRIWLILLVGIVCYEDAKIRLSAEEAPLVQEGRQAAVASRRMRVFMDNGGRVDWSPRGDLIAFDRKGKNGFYDVYTSKPDGSDERCVTCGSRDLPDMNKGNPAWHPSGEYLVFQAQTRRQRFDAGLAAPGKGVNNDVWVGDKNGRSFRRLTEPGMQLIYGTLHPHFSHDGSKLVWAELGRLKRWSLKVATLTMKSGLPDIASTKSYRPGKHPRFYESHGFTKDDRQIIFSANSDDQSETGFDIYLLDLESGKTTNLTDSPRDWDEHAQLSPDGRKIVWASSRETTTSPLRLDLWMMNVDGTEKVRLTNVHDSSRPEYMGPNAVGPADGSWSPDGRRLIFYGVTDQQEAGGRIYMLDF